jgi:hypothetical protein
VRTVQRGPTSASATRLSARTVAATCLTVLAAILVLVALTAPNRLELLRPAVFVRLPLEAVVYLAVVLALPDRFARVRTALAVGCGVLLGIAGILKVLDMGFFESLNRPFDVVIDWRYGSSLVHLVLDSFGDRLGIVLLAAGAVGGVALLVLTPLALVRVTRATVRHRVPMIRAVTALALLWSAFAALDLRADGGTALASQDASAYVFAEVSGIPATLQDQREFTRAAEEDPLRPTPARELLAGLRGKDVLFVFVESYGRVALEDSSFAPDVTRVLDSGTARLRNAGFSSRSAFLTSPTFGALSWLAHSTFQSGLWIDSQQRYDALLTSPRLTLSRIFGAAGWRTVADIPANTYDWPQGSYYGYDHVYDSRNVGYKGPRFGYPTMPDQFTLEAFHRMELERGHRPVMAEIDLISSHAPWSRTPHMVAPRSVGDGSVFDGMPERLPSETDIWPSPTRVQAAYGKSIEYSLRALVSFVTRQRNDDLVLVVLGDHQPATIVTGPEAGHDVPISVVARDPAVIRRISGWGWQDGLRPKPDGPVWPMDAFRDRFLAAFASRSAEQRSH